jgi:DNA sulfur modification protein DndD
MIFDELVLHNFGSFAGRHRVLLRPPGPTQPVVLIGAKNGSGKTTILDSIQLALYGRLARCSTRGDESYDEFLRKSTHRGLRAESEGAVELQFTHSSQGIAHTYRIHRSWEVGTNGNAKERLEIVCDGVLNKTLTEQWADHIEAILPVRLSPFFFFDGEKIAALADPQSAPEVLRTALDALLGLDIVDRLRIDLIALERRKRSASVTSQGFASEISSLEAAKNAAEDNQRTKAQDVAAVRNQLQLVERNKRALEERYASEGGLLADDHRRIERDLATAREELSVIEQNLREAIGEELSLGLLKPMIISLLHDAMQKADADARALVLDELHRRDQWLLNSLQQMEASEVVFVQLSDLLHQERMSRVLPAGGFEHLLLNADERALVRLLLEEIFADAETRVRGLLETHRSLRELTIRLERLVASVPTEEAISNLRVSVADNQRELVEVTAQLGSAEAAYEQAQRDLIVAERKLDAFLNEKASELVESAESERVLRFSEQARQRLDAFRTAAMAAHLGRLAGLIETSFRALHRKKDFVRSLRIDASSMTIELTGSSGERINSERLSAGERQLLATAILWALAKASGRTLPVIVDTPLGRLDSDHRNQLVSNYFPHASHQVILLSTDEEIDVAHLASLSSSIGRRYLLEFNEVSKSTRFVAGYFWEETAA